MSRRTAVVNAWEALFRAQVSVMRDIDDGFPELQLTLTEYDLLFNLSRLPGGSRPRDLHRNLLLSQPSVSRLIDRLADRGLVAKQPDPDDGRGIVVQLTDAGWSAFRRAAGIHSDAIVRRFGDRLDEAELAELTRLCGKLRE